MGRLPEQTQANLQMVGGMRQQQENTTMSLRTEQDRLAMLERQIEAMKRGASDAPLVEGGGSAPQERVLFCAVSSTRRRRCTPRSIQRCSA